MAHSFVEFRGLALRLRDVDITAAIEIAIAEADKRYGPYLAQMRIKPVLDSLRYSVHYSGVGCIELSLDKLLSDEELATQLLSVLSFAESKLKEFGHWIPEQYLNDLAGMRWVGSDIDAFNVLEATRQLQALVRGEEGKPLPGNERHEP